MNSSFNTPACCLLGIALLGAAAQFFPQIDLFASGLFYWQGKGFLLSSNSALTALHELATAGSRVLGAALCVAALASLSHGIFRIVPAKTWLFLLAMLLIGPGLVANVAFKDNWGRARPREVSVFGGTAAFTPPLTPQPNARANGSFVAGDAAFGFSLPSFAMLIPLPSPKSGGRPEETRNKPYRISRRIFWSGIAMGFVFGLTRLAMGAHFFSDIVFAMILMLATLAALQTVFYGKGATKRYWRCWLAPRRESP